MVCGWVFFRSATLADALTLLQGMAGAHGVQEATTLATLLPPVPTALLIGALGVAFLAPNTWEIRHPRTRLAALALGAALFLCVLQFAKASPFLYFQF